MFYFVFIFQTCSVMAFLILVMLLAMPLGMKGAVKMFLQDTQDTQRHAYGTASLTT